MKDINQAALDAMKDYIGKDDNASHYPARWATWLQEADNNCAELSIQEIACIALIGGYKVYSCDSGYFGSGDYLITDNKFTLDQILKDVDFAEEDGDYFTKDDFSECKDLADVF